MEPGSIVVLHLVQPTDKYWGRLLSLQPAGLTLRGINLSFVEDWIRSVAEEASPALGLSTIFFPLSRVEQMFLDEPVGGVESYAQRFERRVGRTLQTYLGE